MLKRDEANFFNFQYLKNGEEKGFTHFYNTYHRSLINYGCKILRDQHWIENIVQDAFITVWEHRAIIESPRHLYCFLRQCVKWGCYALAKKQMNRRVIYTEFMDEHCFDDLFGETLSCDNQELIELVYKAIPLLPPERKTIVELYFKYGFSCKEIAGKYASSTSHVAYQLRDSLEFLKKLIKRKKEIARQKIFSLSNYAELKKRNDQLPTEMSDQVSQLFKMRYEQHYSFERISCQLGMAVADVQQLYIEAHRKLRLVKQQKQLVYG